MLKNLYLIMGSSGSGKNFIAAKLESELNLQRVISCTSRTRRDGEDENAYHFLTEEEILQDKSMLTLAKYAGNYYGARLADIEKADLYIIEPEGVRMMLEYDFLSRPIKVILLDVDRKDVATNMSKRGDNKDAIEQEVLLRTKRFDRFIIYPC